MKSYMLITILAVAMLFGGNGLFGVTATAEVYSDATLEVLRKPNLKILHLGNSYTFDAVSYLPLIVESTGADISDLCIYRAMMAGGSFMDWYMTYNDISVGKDYSLEKVTGGIDANCATGLFNAGDGSVLRRALSNEQWDIVVVQQVSTYSPYYAEWGGKGTGGYMNELLDIIKEQQPQALIGLMLVHSYASNYSANKEGSSLKRWELIAESVKQCSAEKDIDFIIPYGTAVQNLRATSLNNEMDLTADGIHCEYVLTRYTASCSYYQSVLAPRTGISVTADKTRINKDYLTSETLMVSLDDATAPIAQRAALLAADDWYHCWNPEEVTAPEEKAGDVNGDKAVDVADIATVISAMAEENTDSFVPKADVNGDGVVDVADIATIITIMSGGGDTEM